MQCADLYLHLPLVEELAKKRVSPEVRVSFAQQLIRLREALKVLDQERESCARRHAALDAADEPVVENGQIQIEDVQAFLEEWNAILKGPADVQTHPLGEKVLTKETTPAEIAALLQLGLYVVPEASKPALVKDDEE